MSGEFLAGRHNPPFNQQMLDLDKLQDICSASEAKCFTTLISGEGFLGGMEGCRNWRETKVRDGSNDETESRQTSRRPRLKKKEREKFRLSTHKKVFCILPPFVGATTLDITTFRIKTLSVTILQEVLACNLKKMKFRQSTFFPPFVEAKTREP